MHSQPIDRMELQKLPEYTYVPGWTPHPNRAADFHVESSNSSTVFHRGCLLFNLGFYWESHEAWEELWIRCGRVGPAADEIKALIKLSAAGVKVLVQNPFGARRHLHRSIELLQNTLLNSNSDSSNRDLNRFQNEDAKRLIEYAESLLSELPVASESDRQSARTGGVPILGQLPFSL